MTADGRISIAGLNSGNLDYIAEAFHAVTVGKPF
jgi:aspartate/tyrosine/aromatic aminotransferase